MIPPDDQIEGQIGHVIGHHYNTGNSPSLLSMASQPCCGLESSDLGAFHSEELYDDDLPLGSVSVGLNEGVMISGVAAYIRTSKFYLDLKSQNKTCKLL